MVYPNNKKVLVLSFRLRILGFLFQKGLPAEGRLFSLRKFFPALGGQIIFRRRYPCRAFISVEDSAVSVKDTLNILLQIQGRPADIVGQDAPVGEVLPCPPPDLLFDRLRIHGQLFLRRSRPVADLTRQMRMQ